MSEPAYLILKKIDFDFFYHIRRPKFQGGGGGGSAEVRTMSEVFF
jgi:hypothetical protein